MNKILTSLFILFFLFFFSFYVNAQTSKNDKSVTLDKSEIVNENYFTSGDIVTISGTVNGDIYVAGGNIIIDGIVNGDVFAAGGTITISGSVTEDVRAAGGQLNISGIIGGGVTLGGGNISLSDTAIIKEGIVIGGGSIFILSPIGSSATIGGGQVTIGSQINGNALIGTDQLTLSPKARILGNLTYFSENKADLQKGSYISGETKYKALKKSIKPDKPSAKIFASFFTLISFLSSLIIGLILLKLFPNFVIQTSQILETKFWRSVGTGFIFLFLTPIAILLLFITLVGMPLAGFAIAVYTAIIYISKIFASLFIGNKIIKIKPQKSAFLQLLIGLVAFYLIGVIPLLGWIVSFILILAGSGSFIKQKKFLYNNLSSKKII